MPLNLLITTNESLCIILLLETFSCEISTHSINKAITKSKLFVRKSHRHVLSRILPEYIIIFLES